MTMLARRRRLQRAASRAVEPIIAAPDTEPHWACPVCGEPCRCLDPRSRLAPHLPCNSPEVIAA